MNFSPIALEGLETRKSYGTNDGVCMRGVEGEEGALSAVVMRQGKAIGTEWWWYDLDRDSA